MWQQERLERIWNEHRGRLVGSAAGLVVSLLIIAVGFFPALFIVTCVVVGYFIGKRFDEENESILDLLERYLPGPR